MLFIFRSRFLFCTLIVVEFYTIVKFSAHLPMSWFSYSSFMIFYPDSWFSSPCRDFPYWFLIFFSLVIIFYPDTLFSSPCHNFLLIVHSLVMIFYSLSTPLSWFSTHCSLPCHDFLLIVHSLVMIFYPY